MLGDGLEVLLLLLGVGVSMWVWWRGVENCMCGNVYGGRRGGAKVVKNCRVHLEDVIRNPFSSNPPFYIGAPR